MLSVLEEKLKDVLRDLKHFEAGKLSIENSITKLAFYNTILKFTNNIYKMHIDQKKFGKKPFNDMVRKGIINPTAVIDLSPEEIEDEKVYCELQDKAITRSECLDYSGESNHMDDCKNCETGLANKNLLISGPPLYTV